MSAFGRKADMPNLRASRPLLTLGALHIRVFAATTSSELLGWVRAARSLFAQARAQ